MLAVMEYKLYNKLTGSLRRIYCIYLMRPNMSDLDFTISCTVTFFGKKMTNSPNLNNGKYRPRVVIKGTEEYFEINFIDGEEVRFDKPIRANALPVNEDIDYSALQEGVKFLIMDGSSIVGEGLVKEIFQHEPYKKK